MARRRLSGEGSVYSTADGRARGAVSLPDGRRRYVSGRTEREVLDKIRQIQRDVEDGLAVTSRRAGTLDEYMQSWLTETLPARVATGTVSKSTLNSYSDNYRLHIKPHLGNLRRDKIQPATIRKWQATLLTTRSGRRRKGATDDQVPFLSPRTVAYCHAILRAAINDALHDEIAGFRRNVVELVEPPRGRGKGKAIDTGDLAPLLEQIAKHKWRALWLVYLGTGLRRGEALGLRWPDIDLEAGTAEVTRALTRRDGKLVDVTVKTPGSEATIPLSPTVVAVLRAHRKEQMTARMAAPVWVDPARVFTTELGTPLEPRNVNRAWTAMCTKAGVDGARVHDLRHTMATMALRAGSDMKAIQQLLRHTRLATTSDIYTDVVHEIQREAADKVGDALRSLGVKDA